MGDSTEEWVDVVSVQELKPGQMRTFKHERHQLVVGLDAQGQPFALDNACPHEGYPLAQGALNDCHLTCEWHNWKFELHGGACVLGGEDVRSYPARLHAGRLQVELSDPDPLDLWPGLRRSMQGGLFHGQADRALRDSVRLLQAGYEAPRVLVDLARYDVRHAEYGSTHVLAVCADLRRLLAVRPGSKAVHALAPAIELCIEGNRQRSPRPRPQPRDGADADTLCRLLEEEQLDELEALLRGALRDPSGRGRVNAWMYRMLSEHFTDFGHPLIYMVKAQELLRGIDDPEAVDEILGGLLFNLGTATREDKLPYWRVYREAMTELDLELPLLWQHQDPAAPFDAVALRDAVLEGGAREAIAAVAGALEQGVPAARIARALVAAGALRLARFDPDVDRRADVAETWLWATHRFTFASAVRNAVERFPSPYALRFLFQAVGFVHSGAPMDGADREIELGQAREGSTAQEVLEAIGRRDRGAAVAAARHCLRDLGETARLQLALEEFVLQDPFVRPILHAHAIKGVVAAFEEFEAADTPEARDLPVLAVVRFLASPVVEKRLRQQAELAVQWVAEGRRPRKLTQ